MLIDWMKKQSIINQTKPGHYVLCFIAVLGFSFYTVAVSGMVKYDRLIGYSTIGFIFRTVLFTIFFFICLLGLEFFDNLSFARIDTILKWRYSSIIRGFFFLFLARVPYLVVFYPGITNHDAISQLYDYYDGMTIIQQGSNSVFVFLNDAHPVFDTILYGLFVSLGRVLGNPNLGLFFFSCSQTAILSLCFSIMLCSLDRIGIPGQYRIAGLLYLSFMPEIGLFMISMMKDSTFAVFFVLYCTLYFILICEEPSKKKWILLILCSVFLTLTKKTGLYQVILSNMGLFFCTRLRKCWKFILLSVFFPTVLVTVLLQMIVFPHFNIYSEGTSPYQGGFYAFRFQQVAKAVLDHSTEISNEERNIIDAVLPYDDLSRNYNPSSMDGVSFTRRSDTITKNDLDRFSELWLDYAYRYPGSYITSLCTVNGLYFTPKMTIEPFTEVQENTLGLYNPKELKLLREVFLNVCRFFKFNGKNVLSHMVVYVFWIPILVTIRLFWYHKKGSIIAMLPVYINLLVLAVSPIAISRYAIGSFFIVPLVLGIGSCGKKNYG